MSSSNLPPNSSDLTSGLAALKQKNYQQAIAFLEPIAQSNSSGQFKAKMGLVIAYERTRNTKLAINLCQSLTQSPQENIKNWATDYLKQLLKRYPPKPQNISPNIESQPPELPPPTETGFIPLNPNLQPAKAKSTLAKNPKLSSPPPAKKSPHPSLSQPPSLNLKKTEKVSPNFKEKIPDSPINLEPEIMQPPPPPPVSRMAMATSRTSYELAKTEILTIESL
ncbi:MAG: hypothetical protein RSE13_20830 [Planktothrix sp. GU0601_MAG3]|nr:MAG: hypothetical protein RSE13_20830 [Planktothrix sp. GU0601_MAG3]